MKIGKRLLSIALCLVLVLGLLPVTALAAQQEISEVVATSQDLDSIPQLYGLLKIPEFTVTAGSPVYINSSTSNLSWEKKVGDDWINQYSGRFTPGEWRISTSLRIDGTENVINYKLDEDGVTLTVNGQPWTVEAIHNSTYSFASVYSPSFTINDNPNVQPPVPVESVDMVLNGYAPGAAAASATVTTDANVDVEVLGFLKFIDSNGDGTPDAPPEEVTGNFASGEMYVVGLKIKAKTGYDISGLEFQNISLDRAVMTMPAEFDMNEECFLVTCILGDAMQYTVTFETNGGSAIQPVSVGGGGFVAEPTAPTRAYYAFAGWYSDEELTTPFYFENTPITEDTTLYAKWTPSPVNGMFLMTFDFNGGTSAMPTSGEVEANSSIYLEPNIESHVTPPSGKVFDAYEIDGVRYDAGGDYLVTENFTLKFLWKDAPQQPNYAPVTITIQNGNMVFTNEQDVAFNFLIQKQLLVPNQTGEEFSSKDGKLLFTVNQGLFTLADNLTEQDNIHYTLTSAEREALYAQYTGVAISEIHLIVYSANNDDNNGGNTGDGGNTGGDTGNGNGNGDGGNTGGDTGNGNGNGNGDGSNNGGDTGNGNGNGNGDGGNTGGDTGNGNTGTGGNTGDNNNGNAGGDTPNPNRPIRPAYPSYSVSTPDTDSGETVTSPDTFDGGTALYVGLTILSATGGAWLAKKKED